mmetsp:Transcript_4442/g.7753  ORF Transcript_4442/g.7753 Transcript_4442/m.7753 type:complete len:317 (-) Transcript_4442:155-1105(-)|eukprot:CAMPEP_0197456450 /NCGR_PEP_ID=MMETSP1175-20131217/43403_1 /TAXON_ID=1003142 /ORGANISM="Triceratium dubium, Strain CCMP147" /LENGTH=316 /DNA_ID=CAMNT_0042990533 /DNA_START=133 /DNA_END=1086 /DNA_ORIENTATION=+
MKFFISSHVLRTLLAASYILQNVQSIPPDNVCCDRANDEAGCLAYTEHDSFSFDNCVGAIGVDCDGVPYDLDFGPVGTITVNLAAPVHSSGGVSVIKTSVGSILHDLCCIKNPQGAFCTGTNYPIDETINLWGNADNSCACIMEWRKAAWNLLRGRYWEASFNEAAFSSDLNAVPGLIRESWLPTGSGTNYISYKSNWGLEENGATAQLCAPSGTKLDCPSEDDTIVVLTAHFAHTHGLAALMQLGAKAGITIGGMMMVGTMPTLVTVIIAAAVNSIRCTGSLVRMARHGMEYANEFLRSLWQVALQSHQLFVASR